VHEAELQQSGDCAEAKNQAQPRGDNVGNV